ncbi:MAG: hypothetical protein M1816_004230 [Peltula sp. TS41687]|nr:MAG: hypothetical protein M1816_004230 [Peltula sp. TS41687]
MLCNQALLLLTILAITTASPVRYRGDRLQVRHAPHSDKPFPSNPIIPLTSTVIITITEPAVQSSQPQTTLQPDGGASISVPRSSAVLSSVAAEPSQTATAGEKNTDNPVPTSVAASVFSEVESAITFLDDGKPVGTRTATTFAVTSFDTAGPTETADGQSQSQGSASARFDGVSATKLTTEQTSPLTAIPTTLPTAKASGKQKGSVPAIGNGPGFGEPNFSTGAAAPTLSVVQTPRQPSLSKSYMMVSFTAIPSVLPGHIASVSSRCTRSGAGPSESSGATSTLTIEVTAAASSEVGVSTEALTVQPLPSPSSSSDANTQSSTQPTQASSIFSGTSSLNTLGSSTIASQPTSTPSGQTPSAPANVSPTSQVVSSASVPVGNSTLQTSTLGSSAPREGPSVLSSTLASAPLSSGLANPGTTSAVASSFAIPSVSAYNLPDVTITLPGTGPRLQAGGGGVSSSLQAVPTTLVTVLTSTALSSTSIITSSTPSQQLPSPSTFLTISTSPAGAGAGPSASPSSSLHTSASSPASTDLASSQSPSASMTTVTAPSERPPESVSGSDGASITVVPVPPSSSDQRKEQEKTVTVTTTATAVVTGSAR